MADQTMSYNKGDLDSCLMRYIIITWNALITKLIMKVLLYNTNIILNKYEYICRESKLVRIDIINNVISYSNLILFTFSYVKLNF